MFAVVIKSLGHFVQLFGTRWIIAHEAPLFSALSLGLLRFMSIESVMLSNPLIFCCYVVWTFPMSVHLFLTIVT